MNKVDITSTAVEKAIDLVKDFVEKFLGSSVEEAGLFMSDNIKLRRFKNQIKILAKAQKIVADSNINIKQISLKTLVPLLEYSSLEEEELLQDKWANLLVNYIDSQSKYESSIFPYILNQLSSAEAEDLERLRDNKLSYLSEGGFSGGLDNLIRLGLIEKMLPNLEVSERKSGLNEKKIVVSYSKRVSWYKLTELGISFVDCCSSRKL